MDRREALLALCGLPAAAQFKKIPVPALGPQDHIVIECPGSLSLDQVETMRSQLSKVFPNNKVIVLADGMKLGVVWVRPDDVLS